MSSATGLDSRHISVRFLRKLFYRSRRDHGWRMLVGLENIAIVLCWHFREYSPRFQEFMVGGLHDWVAPWLLSSSPETGG